MALVTVIDDEYASLWYHPDAKIVHHKIKRFLVEGMFERLLTTGAELLEQHGAKKWLSDDRDNVVIAPEDIAWGEARWVPRAAEAGLKYWGVVLPSGAVGSLQLVTRIKAPQNLERIPALTTRIFETVEDALAWLESVPG